MADVSLNSGIRSNLLQLQQSSSLFQRTTERLASGKKVNSAIDSPTNFFAAVNLSDRAEGLQSRLDGIGQAIQAVKAADNGISSIRSFIGAMKGVVNNAIGNSDADERDTLGRQFNELLVQIGQTAKDSSIQGVNLLQGNTTNTVQFNEKFGDSKLDVLGFDVAGPGDDGLAVVDANGDIASAAATAVINQASAAGVSSRASAGSSGSSASAASIAAISASQASQASVASATATGFAGTNATHTAASNTVSFAGGTGYTASGSNAVSVAIGTASAASQASVATAASVASVSATGYAGTNASATVASNTVSFAGGTGYTATGGAANAVAIGTASIGSTASQASAASVAAVSARASVASVASGTVSAEVALYIGNQTGGTNLGIQGAGSLAGSVDWGASNYKETLAAVVQQLEAFDSELKIQAGNLSQNLAAITIREEFSNNLINTLNEGADKLTLADLNEEGANLLALQTSTQLATQSLALASQQSQGVLQLLG